MSDDEYQNMSDEFQKATGFHPNQNLNDYFFSLKDKNNRRCSCGFPINNDEHQTEHLHTKLHRLLLQAYINWDMEFNGWPRPEHIIGYGTG